MTYFCDLHMHSTASDGQYRPAELVRMAKDKGLQVIALTDHDSVDGFEEAKAEADRLGMIVLPGVEMSAREYHMFHILGYCFDVEKLRNSEWFKRLKKARGGKRMLKIHAFLRDHGVDIPLEEVRETAGTGSIGRPHFARVMLNHGICKTWEEVFDTYLDTDEFHAKVENKPSAERCIQAIHEAGGFASIAHPYQTGLAGAELEALVQRMKEEYGMEAIECWHSEHTQEQITHYLYLARKYGLMITGGSDFHGEKVKAGRPMAKLMLEMEERCIIC